MVEQWTENPCVVGSIPTGGKKDRFARVGLFFYAVFCYNINMKLNNEIIAFTGGGTGGHIYPGLAVADQLKLLCKSKNQNIKIIWLGCSKGMDSNIVSKAIGPDNKATADKFYPIPSGKLRRYFSFKNFTDLFNIAAGFFKSYHVLRKNKPCALFSKGGFVSVPPCIAARLLKIPVYTHECDFTLGLANKINFKSAKKMFLSYEETKNSLSAQDQKRVIVTGNPIRPVFYNTNPSKGLEFANVPSDHKKPLLLVLGGSSGAKQINELVYENLDFLCQNFYVVHQTGLVNANEEEENKLKEKYDSYKPFPFIYQEMPDLLSSADLVLSRAGANSIWEAAVLHKPMILIPLCGNGTRGDQVDNSKYFEEKGGAVMLLGKDASAQKLKEALENLLDEKVRKNMEENLIKIVGDNIPAKKIAEILYEEIEEKR